MGLNNHLLTHELRIILACVGSESTLDQSADFRKVIPKNTDWQSVIEYAQHHRLIPLIYNHLNTHYSELVPIGVLDQFKKVNEQVVRQSLAQAAELKRIIPALNQNSIDAVILKGRALAKQLYGDISMRQSRDIDLLVRKSDVIKTDSILHDLGFNIANLKSGLPLDSALGRRFIRGRPELDYISKSRSTFVDLHWHLSHSFHAFPVDMTKLWSKMRLVENEYGQVHELPLSMHFIFLCYHGAKHHWLRLHWLLDIAILINQGNLDWDYIIESAKQLGVLPAISLASILTNRFFNTPVPDLILQNSSLMDNGHKLTNLMIKDMIRNPADIENQIMPFMDFKRIKIGHRLQTRLEHRFFTWTDLIFPSETDYQSIKIPDFLFFLYFFIRPLRLAGKLIQRVLYSLAIRKPDTSEAVNRL